MSTDIAVRDTAVVAPVTAEMDSWITVCSDVIKVANVICDTPFVPDGLRGSGPAVAAAILAGRELQLGPMTSLANIHVIKGKPALSAVLMRALVLSQGHQWEDIEVTDSRAVIRGKRRGEAEWTTVMFTADQARRARIDLGGYPQDKLYARATSRLARRKFADVIAGMPYSAEELEDGDEVVTEAVAPAEAAKPAPRTARRRAAPKTAGSQDAGESRQYPVSAAQPSEPASRERPDRPATAQPPLPGEEDGEPMATSGQVGIIVQHFKRLGFGDDDREERLNVTARIAAVEGLSSTRELTDTQAKAVMDTLSRCKDRAALFTLLDAKAQDDAAEVPDDDA